MKWDQIGRAACQGSRLAKRARCRRGLLAGLAMLTVTTMPMVTSDASIRMDGSEFQGTSLVANSSTTNKLLVKHGLGAISPSRIVATFGQPLMGIGTMTPQTSNGIAFKLGLGYDYNVLKTSYDYECGCQCAGDPACDGSLNIRDVVWVIDVAYRGAPATKSGTCPYADVDVDCSGMVNTLDVVMMIDVVFRAVPAETYFCNPCK